ncbi:Gasdermin-C [Galemys pyrenaicus]|uniref:Gasdermin-C n=1 Tax=Galemys pyrenaicus TaxID=202257 RepID=A0A8J6DQ08_GALPY|nr:Gasdermin-C [Galemys pyrenaicus]
MTKICTFLLFAPSNMPSPFQKTCELLVKEIGDKEMLPVTSFLDATKIHHFTILRTKNRGLSRFWSQPDVTDEVSIMDILEKSSSEPGIVILRPEEKTMGTQMVEIITTPLGSLTELLKRKLRGQELPYLEECWKLGVDLYVVTETMELFKSSELHARSRKDISGSASIPWKTMAKGNIGVKYDLRREKKIGVQKGMVVAYKKKKLIFRNNGWGLLLLEDDKKKKTFEEYFKYLQKEVFQKVEELNALSRSFQDTMLNNIQAMLGNHEALQELRNMLEQEPLGCLNGPGGTILDVLRENSEYSYVNPKYFISYLLEAIIELSDTQHALLARSMEKKILPHQQELVRSILEPNFKYPWCIPFTLDPQLLAPLQGEGVAITYGLLQECGLRVEPSNPRSTWDLEAKKPLSALYASLTILHWMAKA